MFEIFFVCGSCTCGGCELMVFSSIICGDKNYYLTFSTQFINVIFVISRRSCWFRQFNVEQMASSHPISAVGIFLNYNSHQVEF